MSWWIWIGFILIFLFNVFRKLKGAADPTDKISGRNAERAAREARMEDMLQTLRETAAAKAARAGPGGDRPKKNRPAKRPAPIPSPAPAPFETATRNSGPMLPGEERPIIEDGLTFSDHPVVQGIVLSEILSPPLGLRSPERLV